MYANQVADNSLYYNNYQDPYNQGYYDYTAEDQSLFPSQEADRYLHYGYMMKWKHCIQKTVKIYM